MSNDPLGGMHTRPVPLDRLSQLEQQMRIVQSQLDSLRAEPRLQHPYHVRLCRTRSDSTYPTAASGANTFELVFLDMDFTESEGDNPATLTELSAASQRVGKRADDIYVPEDTDCLAVTLPNRKLLLLPLTFLDSSCKIGIAQEAIARRTQGSYVLDHGEVEIYTVNASHTLVTTGETVEAYNATSSTVYNGALVLLADDGSGRPLVKDHISSARLAACSARGGPELAIGTLPWTIPISAGYGGAYSSSSNNECYFDSSGINFPANRGIYLIDWSVAFKYTSAPDQDANAHFEGFKVEPYFDGSAVAGGGRWCMFFVPPKTGGGTLTATNADNLYSNASGQFAVLVNDAGQKVEFKVTAEKMAINARSDFTMHAFSVNCHAAGPGELAELEDFSVPWRE